MSRRIWRAREVFCRAGPPAFWKRRLNASLRRLPSSFFSSVLGLGAQIGGLHVLLPQPSAPTRATKRVLIGSLAAPSAERFLGDDARHAVELEQDAAGLHARRPEFGRALAGAHADFGGLLRHRHVRENADPDAAGTLHVTRDGAAGRLDLARREAIRLHRLQPVRSRSRG